MTVRTNIAVVGAGAAGLFASIWSGRTLGGSGRVHALDGATKLGAKVLVAGGGRCNVTHDVVDETAYAGSSRNAIRKVLGRFGVAQTVTFFRELGVELKREETGKLFPVSDDGQTVLSALLGAVRSAGAEIVHPWRVAGVERSGDGFAIRREGGADTVWARRVILATGGKSLPKTGSDGAGFEIARSLGHSITARVFPALVPLTLAKDHWLLGLSGVTLLATLEVRAPSGKKLASFTDSTLLTHFGLSGPSALDISRYCTQARLADEATQLVMNWLPGETVETLDQSLASAGRKRGMTVLRQLEARLPERVLRALCGSVGVDASASLAELPREKRRLLASAVTELKLPMTGDRGYLFAEATAGGVPLSELKLETMESRVCPGLHICGELCDVDGRVGGYNFQWAWASGFVAGTGAATTTA